MKDYIEERAVEIAAYIIDNNIEILYIWLNDKRERTINLDVYSFFFFRKILIVNIQNAMFI